MVHLATVPDRTGFIALADRRRLAFAEYGPLDGIPVLFVPGAASGRLANFGVGELGRRGIRLVSVDRPGLGDSTADPDKTLRSVGADLADLARELTGGAVPIVANSQGAPFALAAASLGAATRVDLVSPVDEVSYPPVRALLDARVGAFVDAVVADPSPVPDVLAGFTAEAFVEMVLGDVPRPDAAVYDDPAFRTTFRRIVDDAFRGGSAGYARDTALAMRPWGLPLGELDVPVTIWFGEHDRVHSPDLGSTLASRMPRAERIVVDGEGGALLWSRPDLVLDAISRS